MRTWLISVAYNYDALNPYRVCGE